MQAERRIKTVGSQTGPGVPVITELLSLHLTVVLWSAVVLADIWQAVVCFPLPSSPRLSEPWRWQDRRAGGDGGEGQEAVAR